MNKYIKYGLVFIGISIFSSCGLILTNLNKAMAPNGKVAGAVSRAGDSLGEHVVIGANKQVPKLIDSLVAGINKAEKNVDTEFPKILKYLNTIGDTGKFKIKEIGDNINGTVLTLKKNIKDSTLTLFIDTAIGKATKTLNQNTKYILSNMIQTALDSLNSSKSKHSLDIAFDNILRDTTKLQKAIHATIQPTIDTILNRVDQIVHKDVPFIQKRASDLLILLGAIALIIIGFIWRERRKYANLVEILTMNIDKMQNQNDYDTVTHQIQDEARKKKIEPLLRKTLYTQGINAQI